VPDELLSPAAPLDAGSDPGTPDSGTAPANAPVSLADDALVSVKVNGQDQTLPWREARESIMRQSAFTQKTQELAAQRRALDEERQSFSSNRTEYEQKLANLREVMTNPQALASLWMMQQARQQQQTAGPQPLTSDAIPQIQQTIEQQMQARFEQFQQQLTEKQQNQYIAQDVDQFTKGLLAQHPLLAANDGIADSIAGKVASILPRGSSLADAKELIRAEVESRSAKLTAAFEAHQKSAAVAKQSAFHGIEPRGGAPLTPTPMKFNSTEDRNAAMLEMLNQLG
jgi:hypothetical protein